MSIYDKISNAQETTWLTDGIAEAEAKSIIELAKISAKIERRRLELNMTQKEFAAYMNVSQRILKYVLLKSFLIMELRNILQQICLTRQLPSQCFKNYTFIAGL